VSWVYVEPAVTEYSGGQGGPPGPLGLAIPQHSDPHPIALAWELMEAAYLWPPWLTGSYHPRSGKANKFQRRRDNQPAEMDVPIDYSLKVTSLARSSGS
jgi:hypothetical protein